MNREEVSGLKIEEVVVPIVGRRSGERAKVKKVDMDSGAFNGWVTVEFPDGKLAAYSGEEIRRD